MHIRYKDYLYHKEIVGPLMLNKTLEQRMNVSVSGVTKEDRMRNKYI